MPRIKELDYLKGILILLVISFHLVYFEQLHPDIKQVVFTFHMPGFLLISGYLMNISKEPRQFLKTLLWLAVPYLVMESAYIYMASILPINEHIDNLTPTDFLDRLLLHPIGIYWYLHTLILCGAIYYIIYNNVRGREAARFLLTGIIYYVLSRTFGVLTFSSSMYFLAGALMRQTGREFLSFFCSTKFAILVFILLAFHSESPNQSTFVGVLIVYFAISSLLWSYTITPPKGGRGVCFLGQNTLPLYIFSPIFTFLCKRFVPYLQFDPTGLLFLFVSLVFCVAGGLLIAWLMDLTGISRFFFGRKALSI
ncbi:MAG: acyltransferase [Bacteroidaceae bacterium]|nr:acyltransferase [Bacteroidaceae bacterium]